MLNQNQISFQMRGKAEDNGNVRLEQFISQLATIKEALEEVERLVSPANSKSVYFRVANLTHSSPATVVLEAVPLDKSITKAPPVINKFFDGVYQIQQSQALPDFDFAAMQALKKMTSSLSGNISELVIGYGENRLSLDTPLAKKIDEILGPDEFENGSVTGIVKKVNLQTDPNTFTIYSISGKVETPCVFSNNLRDTVKAALGRPVTVYGIFKYKPRTRYPYKMEASEIELHPLEEHVPNLSDLRGIAPAALGGKSTEEFIWKIRNEWE